MLRGDARTAQPESDRREKGQQADDAESDDERVAITQLDDVLAGGNDDALIRDVGGNDFDVATVDRRTPVTMSRDARDGKRRSSCADAERGRVARLRDAG